MTLLTGVASPPPTNRSVLRQNDSTYVGRDKNSRSQQYVLPRPWSYQPSIPRPQPYDVMILSSLGHTVRGNYGRSSHLIFHPQIHPLFLSDSAHHSHVTIRARAPPSLSYTNPSHKTLPASPTPPRTLRLAILHFEQK